MWPSHIEPESLWLIGSIVFVLGVASLVGFWLKRRLDTGLDPEIVGHFHRRVRVYWIMCAVLATTILLNYIATVVLFGFLSFWALREFITLTPTRRGDHRGLFWAFFVFTPLQYVLVGFNLTLVYTVFIPAFACLYLAARGAIAGDSKRFLERTAKTQAGLLICVYCLSFAPALLTHELPRRVEAISEDDGKEAAANAPPEGKPSAGQATMPTPAQRARLLFFFVVIAQLSEIMEYVWSRMAPSRPIAAEINPAKTWGGFLGGVLSAAVLGALFSVSTWPFTGSWAIAPFTPWEAAALSAVVGAVGLAGGLTMSAIKRDRGVRDFGTLVVGHGGVLDRIDALCFAAPVFFFLTRLLIWRMPECTAKLPW